MNETLYVYSPPSLSTFTNRPCSVDWVRNYPGLVATRVPWDQFLKDWKIYLDGPAKNPIDETLFPMAKPSGNFSGFAMYNTPATGWEEIYPPTGIAQVSAVLVGISKKSRNPALAHSVLIETVARDERFHVNNPRFKKTSPTGGVSGWRSALLTPEYLEDTKDKKMTNVEYLNHAAFVGYPVQQSPSFGLTAQNDPMVSAFVFASLLCCLRGGVVLTHSFDETRTWHSMISNTKTCLPNKLSPAHAKLSIGIPCLPAHPTTTNPLLRMTFLSTRLP